MSKFHKGIAIAIALVCCIAYGVVVGCANQSKELSNMEVAEMYALDEGQFDIDEFDVILENPNVTSDEGLTYFNVYKDGELVSWFGINLDFYRGYYGD